MANNHKHSFMYRNEVIGGYWKLHRLFRNPTIKRVLVGCELCHPKKKLAVRKVGRIYELNLD